MNSVGFVINSYGTLWHCYCYSLSSSYVCNSDPGAQMIYRSIYYFKIVCENFLVWQKLQVGGQKMHFWSLWTNIFSKFMDLNDKNYKLIELKMHFWYTWTSITHPSHARSFVLATSPVWRTRFLGLGLVVGITIYRPKVHRYKGLYQVQCSQYRRVVV